LKIGFAGLETAVFTVVKAGANTTLAEIGVGIRATLAADAVLSKLIAISDTAAAVIFTSLVDGVLIAPTVTITGSGASATTYTVGALTDGTAGTTAVDVIDGGAGADVLVGGGADTITTGAGADNVFMLQNHSVLAAMATISDFTFLTGGTSNDKLIIGDVTSAIGTVTTVQDLSSSATLAIALDAAALANTGVASGLSVFIWGGNEYAYVEATAANTTYTATDFVVKLTGLPLASGATIAGSGFDAV